MAYQLIWEEKGLWADFKGTVNDNEINEVTSRIYGHEQFGSIRYILIDFLDVDNFNVTERAVRTVAGSDRTAALTNPNIMVGIVTIKVSTLEKAFLYTDASEGTPWQISYFDNIEDARAWIANALPS